MDLEFKFEGVEEFIKNLETYGDNLKAKVWAYINWKAPQISAYMRETAPWQDRTGDARRLLYANPIELKRPVSMGIRLGHIVKYGIHLELGMQGRFAILRPTIEHFFNDFNLEIETIMHNGEVK